MHEERSFSYHVRTLVDLLEVLILTQHGALDFTGISAEGAAEDLTDVVARMAGVMASTWEEIGDLPLMNDSEELPEQLVQWVIAKASGQSRLRLPNAGDRCQGSGFLVGSVGPWGGAFDVGKAGPDHQMGHAHADHLSFEIWHGGKKLVCDSGTATYDEGEKRQRYRSTLAHNTVRIDGVDSLETWGCFRVGQRPKRHVAEIVEQKNSRIQWFGQHDGYRHLAGEPTHGRRFCMDAQGVFVLDRIEGRGRHFVESLLHLHPRIALERCSAERLEWSTVETLQKVFEWPPELSDCRRSVWQWQIEDGAAGKGFAVALWPVGCEMSVEMDRGFYAPAFSIELECAVLRLRGSCSSPSHLGWIILSDVAG